MTKTINNDNETFIALLNLTEELLKTISESISATSRIVEKNNGTRCRGIVISDDKKPFLSPTIYVDDAIERIGKKMSDVKSEAANISKIYLNSLSTMPEYEHVRDYFRSENLFVSIVNAARNKDRTKDIVHTKVNDLSLVLRCHVGDIGSFEVRKEQLSHLQLTASEAMNIAIGNTVTSGYEILPMEQMLMRLAVNDPEQAFIDDILDEALYRTPSHMYVVTSKDNSFGAALPFISKEVREELSELMPTRDYIILPSSIHECIAISADETVDAKDLLDMVREVNLQIDPTEKLSDNIYYVNGSSLTIETISSVSLAEKNQETLTQVPKTSIAM